MIYAYVNMNISHPENLAKYREHASSALAKHGGAVLVAGKNNKVVEGSATAPDMAAVLSFPDEDSAHSWISDPELADVHELRENSGDVSIILIG